LHFSRQLGAADKAIALTLIALSCWSNSRIDPSLAARSLWLESHPLQVGQEESTSSDRQGPEPQVPKPLQA